MAEPILRAMRYAIERQRLEAARSSWSASATSFSSSVSHDLRTPVAAIKAAIGVVLANEPPNMPPRCIGCLATSTWRPMSCRLIEDLLEIARLQAGRVSCG